MSLPVHNKQEIEKSGEIINNLTSQYFKGRNAEILNELLAKFSVSNPNQLFEAILSVVGQKIDFQNLNNTEIEQLDIIGLAKEIAGEMTFDDLPIQASVKEKKKFEETLKDFSHSALHDVAFPLMIMENPNLASSAKNLIKRVVSSMQLEEGVDMSDVYQTLDIENLPTEFSMDMFLRLGGNIPGLEQQEEVIEEENETPSVLFCELSTEQAVYLSHVLQKDYFAIKNWKVLYHLLKSNGKKYDSLIVDNDNKGILLSVLDLLHERKTIADVRFLRSNKGYGIWPFFQGFLIDSKTDQTFSRELRKLRSEHCRKEDAQKIIDEIFDKSKTNKINQTAEEIINTDGI